MDHEVIKRIEDRATALDRLRKWYSDLRPNVAQLDADTSLCDAVHRIQFVVNTDRRAFDSDRRIHEEKIGDMAAANRALRMALVKAEERLGSAWCDVCNKPQYVLPDGTHDCASVVELREMLNKSGEADRGLFRLHGEMQEEIKQLRTDLNNAQRDAANFSTQLAHAKNKVVRLRKRVNRLVRLVNTARSAFTNVNKQRVEALNRCTELSQELSRFNDKTE